MNVRDFPIHGSMQISVEDRFLLIEGSGPANLEAILDYQKRVQEFREQLNHSPWVSLVVLKGEPLLPPEAKSLLIETINFACKQHLVATAVVFADVKYQVSVQAFWESVYLRTTLPYAFFEHIAEAKTWLTQKMQLADRERR